MGSNLWITFYLLCFDNLSFILFRQLLIIRHLVLCIREEMMHHQAVLIFLEHIVMRWVETMHLNFRVHLVILHLLLLWLPSCLFWTSINLFRILVYCVALWFDELFSILWIKPCCLRCLNLSIVILIWCPLCATLIDSHALILLWEQVIWVWMSRLSIHFLSYETIFNDLINILFLMTSLLL